MTTKTAKTLPANVRKLLDEANSEAAKGNMAMAYTLRRVAQRKAAAEGVRTYAYGPVITR